MSLTVFRAGGIKTRSQALQLFTPRYALTLVVRHRALMSGLVCVSLWKPGWLHVFVQSFNW